jgi:hypothetical protein
MVMGDESTSDLTEIIHGKVYRVDYLPSVPSSLSQTVKYSP